MRLGKGFPVCVAVVGWLFADPAHAGIEVLQKTITVFAEASANNDIASDEDIDALFDEPLPDVFDRRFGAIVGSGGAASAEWRGLIQYEEGFAAPGDSKPERLGLSASLTDVVFAQGDGPLGGGRCANAAARTLCEVILRVRVDGDPVELVVSHDGSLLAQGAGEGGCGGDAFAIFGGVQVTDPDTGALLFNSLAGRGCGSRNVDNLINTQGCGSASRSDRVRLVPGDSGPAEYTISVATEAIVGRAGNATTVYTWQLELLPPQPCELVWNEFGSGGLFSDANNWAPPRAPEDDGTGCQDLLIDRAGAFTIGVSGDQAANSLRLNRGDATLASSTGGRLSLSRRLAGTTGLQVAEGADLTVRGVELTANNVAIGDEPGGDGRATLRVVGAGSALFARAAGDADAEKDIGVAGGQQALFEVLDGAAAACGFLRVGSRLGPNDTPGEVVVGGDSGGNPARLTVRGGLLIGNGSRGIVRVRNGGRLTTLDGIDVDVGAFSAGELLLEGDPLSLFDDPAVEIGGALRVGKTASAQAVVTARQAARLSAASFRVGVDGGPGNIAIQSGAEAQAGDVLVGGPHNGVVALAGRGALTATNLRLGVAPGGAGSLTVNAGEAPDEATRAEVATGLLEVGSGAGVGTLIMAGSGSLLAEAVEVPFGDNAKGDMRLTAAARLRSENRVRIGTGGAGARNGDVEVLGNSVLEAGQSVDVFRRGRLAVTGSVISPKVRVIGQGGKLVGIRPRGKQAGAPRISGDVELEAGAELELDVGGGGPALEIGGNLIANGTLSVIFDGNAPLAADDLVGVLAVAGQISGGFESVRFPNRSDDFEGTLEIDGGTVQIRVVNPGEAVGEGEPEGSSEGEGSGEGEGTGEGEGEDPPTPPGGCAGCGGCDAKGGPVEKALGDWVAAFFGLTALLATHLHLRRRLA